MTKTMDKIKSITINAPELDSVEPSKAEMIRATFEPMVEMLTDFEEKFNSIVAESGNGITPELSAKAKRCRLDIGKVRIETEKLRKEQKDEYLRAGKAIDGVANLLKWAVSDKENKLKEIEEHQKRIEEQRIAKLQLDRADLLSKYVEDAHERDLGSMDEDVWAAYISQKEKDYNDRIEAEKKAEAERIENERLNKLEYDRRLEIAPYTQFIDGGPELRSMSEDDFNSLMCSLKKSKAEFDSEQERIRKENERLERERIESERKAKAERERIEAERIKAEKEAQAKLDAERKERERVEAELKRREKEEADRKAEEARQAELKLQLGDKEKVVAIKTEIKSIKLPDVKSAKAKKIVSDIQVLIDNLCAYVDQNSDAL